MRDIWVWRSGGSVMLAVDSTVQTLDRADMRFLMAAFKVLDEEWGNVVIAEQEDGEI